MKKGKMHFNRHQHNKSKRGFTLIELLVVIAIISLLSSIVLAALREARYKALDVVRIHDIKQIRDALDQYYADHGEYPGAYTGSVDPNTKWAGSWSNWTTSSPTPVNIEEELKPYIGSLPKDPADNSSFPPFFCCGYTYFIHSDGQRYDLITILQSKHKDRCEIKNWKSYTGGYINEANTTPGEGNSWCFGGLLSFVPVAKGIYADH